MDNLQKELQKKRKSDQPKSPVEIRRRKQIREWEDIAVPFFFALSLN
jgi:hypothetical protein